MTDPQSVRTDTHRLPIRGSRHPSVDGKYVYCIIRLDKPKDFGASVSGWAARVHGAFP
jgi:hypothetical protein